MRGTTEQLREQHPGMWLLIRLDGPEAEVGELLAANADPVAFDKLLAGGSDRGRPLYLTYSISDKEPLPAFAL